MKARIQTITRDKIELELDDNERRALAALVQNPQMDNEDSVTAHVREVLFNLLTQE